VPAHVRAILIAVSGSTMMGYAKQKPLYDPASDYEADFYLWSYEQAELLRQGRFSELDLPNIIEEIESLGRSDKRALTSAYRVLIRHLLKWQYQPQKRSVSWQVTIRAQRTEIETLEDESPSLAAKAGEIVSRTYAKARSEAAEETFLPLTTFPESCGYLLAQLRDFDWLPGESSED
jgi:hypothetical protein